MELDAKRQQAQAMAAFPPLPDALLYLIRQDTVRMAEADEPNHNSSWDYAISPDGHHYFSACAESLDTYYLRLYEYLPDTNECKRILGLEDVAVTYPRAIRASKIHSSLSFLPDGKILFATHTTAAAPGHPRWMPFAYYDHPWEGFPGSNVLLYDPITGKTEDLGIPVPRESIYGGQYEATTHSFYFFGYHRGHAYRFDLATRRVTDFGQATEFGTWRTIPGADGNLYGTTASGRLIRINIAKQCIEDVPYNFPFHAELINRGTNNKLMHYANHPDGGLYFTALSCKNILRYDYQTKAVETLVRLVPPEVDAQNMDGRCMGMAIDAYGVLWYLCEVLGLGALLCAWDPHGDDAPRSYGLLGTRDRVFRASFGCFIRDDVLYMSDTNHGADAPGVVSVDLQKLREDADKPRILCQDPLLYFPTNGMPEAPLEKMRPYYRGDLQKDAQRAFAFNALVERDRKHAQENHFVFGTGKRYVCKLWKRFGTSGSQVTSVAYDGQGNVQAVIGAQGGLAVTVKDGEAVQWKKAADCSAASSEEIAQRFAGFRLPAHPGRQYLVVASACGEMADGGVLVGTKDGMLALVKENKVFALGAVCNDGPIRAIAVDPEGKKAYGVGGDPDSLGMVFSYDLETGLELGGFLYFSDGAGTERIGVSCEPCCIAVSPDGKRVTIGVNDNLGCVYEIEV